MLSILINSFLSEQNLTSEIQWIEINTRHDLNQHLIGWQNLADQTDDGFFTSPAWLLPWLDCYWKKEWQLKVFIAKVGGKYKLIAPFYIQKKKLPCFHLDTLYLLGQGEKEYEEVASEYQDVLCQQKDKELLTLFATKLALLNYDTLNFRALKEDSNLVSIAKKLKNTVVEVSGIRYLTNKLLPQTITPSKNNKYKWNKTKRLLANENAEFGIYAGQELINLFPRLIELHTQRWQKRNKSGAFSSDNFIHFHKILTSNNHTCASIISIESNIVAVNYYLKSGNTLYFYQCGWAQGFSYLSPGFALHKWSIENLGGEIYDFMMGSTDNSYKRNFQCNQQSNMYNIEQKRSPVRIFIYKILAKLFTNCN